ncbi:MAG TPA: hypothetical protein DDW23_05940 [Planctomycetes bacterium]|nr:hypothetical protein [Planctomycetota bacterium]|tara:strand:+ start:1349 stop:1750 length:402 start_codon:yes stop_codon:yes gene_type:complete
MRIALLISIALAASCANYKLWGAEDILRGEGDEVVQIKTWVEGLEVQDVAGRIEPDGLSAQFAIVSKREEPIRIELSWLWKDGEGFIMRPAQGGSGKQNILLRPEAPKVFSFMAPSVEAVKFYGSIIPLDRTP